MGSMSMRVVTVILVVVLVVILVVILSIITTILRFNLLVITTIILTIVLTSDSYSKPESRLISYEDILWIRYNHDNRYELSFVDHYNTDVYTPKKLQITLNGTDPEQTVEKVKASAYKNIRPQKRLLVLVNPLSGQGKARSMVKKYALPTFAFAACPFEVIETTQRLHAQEIAKNLDLWRYDAIVCCSGDGTPHEVINGFAMRSDAMEALQSVPVCQVPCGSGNSMAMSLNGTSSPTKAAFAIVKGSPMEVDLMYMTQGNNKVLSFLSQTYGIVADCDLGTEDMRWMGGSRFAVGAVLKTLSKSEYPCTLSVKSAHTEREQIKHHFNTHRKNAIASNEQRNSDGGETWEGTKGLSQSGQKTKLVPPVYGTVNDPLPKDWSTTELDKLSFFYAGKMPWMSADAFVFPATLPTDGYLDMITWNTDIGRAQMLNLLLKIEKGTHFHSDHVKYSKVEAYRLTPRIPSGYLSIDGESFPLEPFQVEVLPSAGCLLAYKKAYVNTQQAI